VPLWRMPAWLNDRPEGMPTMWFSKREKEITQGISWGFIFYTLLKVVKGKAREIHPMLYIIVLFAVLCLILV